MKLRRACSLRRSCALAGAHAQQRVPEPDEYRMDNYRAPVPAALSGARVITTEEAETIWRDKQGVFIDVLPRPPKPQNLPEGTVWRDKPRFNIPGSLWLPDTGYGKLAEATEDYFRQGLARASGGNNAALLVIYCQENCWMSWNAAKRALSYGYTNVAWFPEGTEGWERAIATEEGIATGAAGGRGRRIAAIKTRPHRAIGSRRRRSSRHLRPRNARGEVRRLRLRLFQFRDGLGATTLADGEAYLVAGMPILELRAVLHLVLVGGAAGAGADGAALVLLDGDRASQAVERSDGSGQDLLGAKPWT